MPHAVKAGAALACPSHLHYAVEKTFHHSLAGRIIISPWTPGILLQMSTDPPITVDQVVSGTGELLRAEAGSATFGLHDDPSHNGFLTFKASVPAEEVAAAAKASLGAGVTFSCARAFPPEPPPPLATVQPATG